MQTPDPQFLASELERCAKRLRADGRAALSRSADWAGSIGASGGDGRRGSGISDPTGRQATHKPDPATLLHGQLTDAMRASGVHTEALVALLAKCAVSRVEREEANDLEAINGRSGHCAVCWAASVPTPFHTGKGGDRLRQITTGERDDTGELICPLACEACYKSWQRRPYSREGMHALIEFDEWHAERLEHLKTTTKEGAQ